jgi:hypothetical protein
MYPVFPDLIEHEKENFLKLLVCIMQNYELKAMFLKIKNGDRWEKSREKHSEFLDLRGYTDIKRLTVGSRMGLT